MDYLLEMKGITKRFFNVTVLEEVDFRVRPGSVCALMGENGAGKSTLMKILAGIHQMDGGEILLEGKQVAFHNPTAALNSGIAMIHQELTPIPHMKVSENIFLGREPTRAGFVDYRRMSKMAGEILAQMDCDIDPNVEIGKLKVADMQMVEIAKAISYDSKIIIMDEPTSALTERETENLFQVIRTLRSQGKGIIYISHKMDEIMEINDTITVLRDGRLIGSWHKEATDIEEITSAMVGRKLNDVFPTRDCPIGEVIFQVENLCKKNVFHDVSFNLRRGEVLGIAGLMGAGRTEVMEALFGITGYDSGTVRLRGEVLRFDTPKKAIDRRIAFVTEDRKRQGLVLSSSVLFNITLPSQAMFTQAALFINEKKERRVAGQLYDKLGIRSMNMTQPVKSLSGGNQQKVVLAKWLLQEPEILILDEPTRGIDVGAKHEIYKLIGEMCAQGKSIIMVSSEMPEVLGVSDRVVVFSNRTVAGELSREEFDQTRVLRMAMSKL